MTLGRRPLLTLVLAGLVQAGCASRPIPPPAAAAPAEPYEHAIQVVRRGWHTDIALPTAGLDPALARLTWDFPGVRYLVFGFGDRAWLLDRDRSPLRLLAALLPGPGAILLTALAAPPADAFGAENVVTLPLTQDEFGRLQRFLAASIDQTGTASGDRLPPLAEGPYPGSVFHASPLVYAATYSCNTWTAEALAVAGLPIQVSGVLFAQQIMARARRASAARQAARS